MDNKKWYKRFSTIFWWLITILPLIILLIGFIGSSIVSFDSINNITIESLKTYYQSWFADIGANSTIWNTILSFFNNFSMPLLNSSFANLFNLFGLTNYTLLGYLFGYMASIQLYHLIFDIVVWLPHFAHNLMDRWC